jgi:hypothetical protein
MEVTLAEVGITDTINVPIERVDLKHEATMNVKIGACKFWHDRAWYKNSLDDVGVDNVHLESIK